MPIFLQKNGLDVTGLDLAANSIATAKKLENKHLSFAVHDMREPYKKDYFDVVFSFFTSFGYFEREAEHLQTLQNIQQNLKSGATFVMDFLNAHKVQAELVSKEEKTIDGVHFRIKRYIRHKTVFKRIEFTDPHGNAYWFRERVRLFTKEELCAMFEKAGLHVESTFGNYQLGAYNPSDSPRLIVVATVP